MCLTCLFVLCSSCIYIFIHVSKLVYSALLNVLRRYRPCRYMLYGSNNNTGDNAHERSLRLQHSKQDTVTTTALDTHLYSTFPFYFFGKRRRFQLVESIRYILLFFFLTRPSRPQDPRKQKKQNKRES